jgi:hypothetical protein
VHEIGAVGRLTFERGHADLIDPPSIVLVTFRDGQRGLFYASCWRVNCTPPGATGLLHPHCAGAADEHEKGPAVITDRSAPVA